MRTQFKFTLRLICTPEYKYTPEYIYTRVFFAHANWTYVSMGPIKSIGSTVSIGFAFQVFMPINNQHVK